MRLIQQERDSCQCRVGGKSRKFGGLRKSLKFQQKRIEVKIAQKADRSMQYRCIGFFCAKDDREAI